MLGTEPTHIHTFSRHRNPPPKKKAVFSLTRLAAPLLEAAGTGSDPARVLNIGSIDGMRVGLVDHFAYSASKAALHQLTKARTHARTIPSTRTLPPSFL